MFLLETDFLSMACLLGFARVQIVNFYTREVIRGASIFGNLGGRVFDVHEIRFCGQQYQWMANRRNLKLDCFKIVVIMGVGKEKSHCWKSRKVFEINRVSITACGSY